MRVRRRIRGVLELTVHHQGQIGRAGGDDICTLTTPYHHPPPGKQLNLLQCPSVSQFLLCWQQQQQQQQQSVWFQQLASYGRWVLTLSSFAYITHAAVYLAAQSSTVGTPFVIHTYHKRKTTQRLVVGPNAASAATRPPQPIEQQ